MQLPYVKLENIIITIIRVIFIIELIICAFLGNIIAYVFCYISFAVINLLWKHWVENCKD